MMQKKSGLTMVAFILVVIGALNWGLVGLFNLNVVNVVLGSISIVERIVYVLVGIAGIVVLMPHMEGGKGEKKEMTPEPSKPMEQPMPEPPKPPEQSMQQPPEQMPPAAPQG